MRDYVAGLLGAIAIVSLARGLSICLANLITGWETEVPEGRIWLAASLGFAVIAVAFL